MINFKVTVRADCSPLPNTYTTLKIPFKSSCSLLVSGRRMSWPLDRSLPSLWLHISEKKPTFLSTDLASLLGLSNEHLNPLLLTDFDATWDWALAISACWGVFPKGSRHHEDAPGRLQGAIARGSQALGGGLGDIPTSCRNHLFRGSSLFLPWSALAANTRFLGGTERGLRTSWGALRPSKSMGVHPDNFSFELEVLFGHFCQLVLMYVWCWGLFVLESVYLGLHIRHPLGIYDLSSGVWVCILFVWLVFLSFVKWKIQFQFTRKILAMKLWLQKKKEDFWTLGGH